MESEWSRYIFRTMKRRFSFLSLSLCLTRCINYCLRMNLSDEKFPVVVFFLPVPINDDRTIGYDF